MYSKADTHIHTNYSDGLLAPEETVEYVATHTDLRVIAITDHDTAEGAFVAQEYALKRKLSLEVIIGQEVTTDEGDIIGLFVKTTLPSYRTAQEAISAIHAQGGLAVAAHPFSRWSTLNNMMGVGTQIFTLPLDGVEVRNGFPANIFSNPLTAWLNYFMGQNLAAMGGSDSHAPFTIGQPYTYFPGRTAADLRQAIETKMVRAGGSLWTPLGLARLLPLLLKRGGLPSYKVAYDSKQS